MSDWRDSTYHYTGSLFILRPEIVFAAQVSADTFSWAASAQPDGTIRYLAYTSVAYAKHGTGAGGLTDEYNGLTLIAGTAPGLDDLGRCRVITFTNYSSTDVIHVWASNQGTNDGELTISTNDYIAIVDERRVWAKKPYVDSSGYIYKDGSSAFDNYVPTIANAGQGYISPPGVSAPINVDFDSGASFAPGDGDTITQTLWTFPDCTPASSSSASVNDVSVPAGFRYASLNTQPGSITRYKRYIPLAVRNGNTAQEGFLDHFEVIEQRHEPAGQRMTFKVYESLPRGGDYFDTIRANKLTVYYVLNEASGSTILDYSGHERNATGTSLSEYQQVGACARLHALGLDGNADYIEESASVPAAINTDYGALTIMLRAKSLGWDGTYGPVIAAIGTASPNNTVIVGVDGDDLLYVKVTDSDSNTKTWTYDPDGSTEWIGVAVTWSVDDGVYCYVNGEQVGTPLEDFVGLAPYALITLGYKWLGYIQHFAIIDGVPLDAPALGVPDRRVNLTPDGAVVLYGEREVYDGAAGSLEDAGSSDREHVKFYGWVHSMRAGHETSDTGPRVYTEIECIDAGQRLAILNRQAFTHERGTPVLSGDYAYIRVADLNADRAAFMVLFYDSNVCELADFIWSGTGETYAFPWWRISQETLYEAVDVICQKIEHKFTCDKTGTLRMVHDWQLEAVADRPDTIFEHIEPGDIVTLDYARSRAPRVYWDWGYGVAANTDDAVDTPTITVYRTVAPGPVPGQGPSAQEYDEQVVASQAELNTREGNRYALANTQWSRFDVEVVWPGDRGFDPARMHYVRLGLPRALAAQFGVTFPYPEYHDKVLGTSPESLIQYLRLSESGAAWSGSLARASDCAPTRNHAAYYKSVQTVAFGQRGIGDGHTAIQVAKDIFGNFSSIALDTDNGGAANGLIDDIDPSAFTCVVWFRASIDWWGEAVIPLPALMPAFYRVEMDSGNSAIRIVKSGADTLRFEHYADSTSKTVDVTVDDDRWHCAALTVNGTSAMKAYLDGAQTGSTQTSLGAWSGSTFSYAYAGTLMTATLAHIATWRSVLTDDQIADLATIDNRFLVYGVDTIHEAPNRSKRVRLELERESAGPAGFTVSAE